MPIQYVCISRCVCVCVDVQRYGCFLSVGGGECLRYDEKFNKEFTAVQVHLRLLKHNFVFVGFISGTTAVDLLKHLLSLVAVENK